MGNPEENFDYGAIREPFHTLIEAVGNKLDREFPAKLNSHPASPLLLLGIHRYAENSYSAIRSLLADVPRDGDGYLRHAPAVAPLVRSLVDALCTCLFLCHDLPARTAWYHRAGYRDLALQLQHLEAVRGDDPSWSEFITELRHHLAEAQKIYGVSDEQARNLRLIDKWPNPGGMKGHKDLSRERREYLEYLYDWQYRALSQDAHLNLLGIVRRTPLYFRGVERADRTEALERLRTAHLSAAITAMLALLTEIELECRFGLIERARYVWGVLVSWDEDARDLYDRFYRPVFERLGL